MIDARAADLRDRLRGRLIAAAATPAATDGSVDLGIIEAYLRGLVADGADGLAVLAHTGRGPYLPPALRADVVTRAVATGVPVIVGVGGRPGESIADVVAAGVAAATLGADGLLVFPPARDAVAVHDALWRATGLPMLAFDLYTRPYPPATLGELLAHPGVAGVKLALLHDAIGCQTALAAARAAGRLAVTGEDRMFGPSLLWGAEAALVGIAAAAVPVTAAVLRAFQQGRFVDFVAASTRLDRLAAVTFVEPLEGYVQRMLWVAAAEGRIPASHAFDPYGTPVDEEERAPVLAALG